MELRSLGGGRDRWKVVEERLLGSKELGRWKVSLKSGRGKDFWK